MCARVFYIILAALFVFVVATVAAFVYLQWWQAILASAATLVMIVVAGKYAVRHMLGSLADLAKGLFETKSRVLRNATADVHSVQPATLPQEMAEWLENAEIPSTDPDDPLPDLAEIDRIRNQTRWFTVESTIFPDVSAARGMRHWDLDDLRLVPYEKVISANSDDDSEDDFSLHDVEVVVDGVPQPAEESKLSGPQRLRFTVGVPPGTRLLKFRYYFEQFGRIELPAVLRSH